MKNKITKLIQNFTNIIFPVTCVYCGSDLSLDDYYRLCNVCVKKLKLMDGLFCQKCGAYLPDGGMHCYNCKKNTRYYFEYIRSAGIYDGIIKNLIHQFKYQQKDYITRILGKLLVDAYYKHFTKAKIDLIVPVPTHWIKKIRRGYNQSELLASHLAKYVEKPIMLNNLIKNKFTQSQVNFFRDKRLNNLVGSFKIKNPLTIREKNILIVDDVCTTASTLNECAKTLKDADANKIYCLTVARD